MDLSHLHLHVADRARSEAFYAQWFGLRVSAHGHEITFMNGDRKFLLALMADPAPEPMPRWFHFGFRIESPDAVAAMLERMAAAQVPIVRPLYRDETFASFRCADPDAYAIEVYWEPDKHETPPEETAAD